MLDDLSIVPFAEVFRRVSSQRLSGDLQVRMGRRAKTIFFDRGALVFAASNAKKDRLGESLVALGRLSEEQFESASALMRQDRRGRFGEALQAAGLMDEKEVGRAVAMQVQRIVLSLFPRTDGVASFEERACPIPPEYMVSLSPHRLLYRGIKSMRSPALIRIGIGELERDVVIADVAPFTYAPERASKEEQNLLDAATRAISLHKLVSFGGSVNPQRLRTAYSLVASGILQDSKASLDDSHPVIQIDTRDFVLSSREPPAGAATPTPTARKKGGDASAAEIELDLGIAEPRPHEQTRPPAPVEAMAGAADAAVETEVEELERQIDLHVTINNHAELLKIYARLAELQPDAVRHRKALAVTMTRFAGTLKQAERQFLEALRLDPDDPDLHYQYGRYYEKLNQKGRARAEYRLALSLSPRHRMARKALEAVAPRDSALSSLKRLFKS